MRKLTTLTIAGLLLTAGLSTPAWAAAPDAPTNVQISWAGDKVRVTWEDNGTPNRVGPNYTGTTYVAAAPAAEAPNEVLLDASVFRDSAQVRVSVRSVGPGRELSADAFSPVFDSHKVSSPWLRNAVALSTTSVQLSIMQDAFEDPNPSDPLDKPAGELLKATVTGPSAGQQTETLIPGGTQVANVPVRAGVTTIKLSGSNEWGAGPARDHQIVQVGSVGISTAFPTRSDWSGFELKSTLRTTYCACTGKPVGEPIGFEIQSRPNKSAPWKKVLGSEVTPGETFTSWPGAAGGQEYRIWVPATTGLFRDEAIWLTPPVSTSAKYVQRYAAIYTSQFEPPSAPVGATVRLNVAVAPGLPMQAGLERWDGKKWVYTRAVQLDATGKASIPIRASGRGTTTKYRITTPR